MGLFRGWRLGGAGGSVFRRGFLRSRLARLELGLLDLGQPEHRLAGFPLAAADQVLEPFVALEDVAHGAFLTTPALQGSMNRHGMLERAHKAILIAALQAHEL